MVVFDPESTGLQPSRGDCLVSVGAVRLPDGAEFATLVHPGRPIPAASTRYHGITDAMVAEAPRAPEALAAFRDFAGSAILLAHVAGFDTALLAAEAERGAPVLPIRTRCSAILSQWLDPEEPDHSLDGLCGRLDIVIEGRHQALGDARATAALWRHLAGRAALRGVLSLAELDRRTRMTRRIEEMAARF